jgi:hypothetical protein
MRIPWRADVGSGAIVPQIDTTVVAYDAKYALTTRRFDGGELIVPNVEAIAGERDGLLKQRFIVSTSNHARRYDISS